MIKEKYVSYTINKETKKEAEKIIRKLGFTPSSVINLLYVEIIENRKVPFDITQHNKGKKVRYMCRIEKKVKKDAEKIIKESGLTPTSLFNIFYKEIIQRQGLPFEVKLQLNNEKNWRDWFAQIHKEEKQDEVT